MLRVALKPSRQLAAVLTAAHVAAAVALVPLHLPLCAKLSVTLLIAASLAYTVRRHALLVSRAALTGIELREMDRAAIRTRADTWEEARILGTTYVSPVLTLVNLRVTGRWIPRHILIVSDNVDADAFRRLRVLLRWGYRTEQ